MALALGALLVFAALAEWALWAIDGVGGDARAEASKAFEFEDAPGTIARDDAGRYVVHPERFFTTAPDYRFKESHLGRYATGAWPFRGRPAEPAPADMARIAVVGDSCVYGASVDVSEGLSQQIATGLAMQGYGRDRVAVSTFGVPGYSTFQLRLLLDDVLDRYEPTAVVLYPAAWNDQGPTATVRDSEMARLRADPTFVEWLDRESRMVAAVRAVFGAEDPAPAVVDEAEAAAEFVPDAAPDAAALAARKRRVSPEELEENLRSMLSTLRGAGVPVVVVSPAHPVPTRARFPDTVGDRLIVQGVAIEMGVPLVDGQQVLSASERSLSSLFVDYVHPSPDGAVLLAEAILPELVDILDREELRVPGKEFGIVSVSPGTAFTFGDERLTVELSGWSRGDPLPVVIIAGAPLLDLVASGEHSVSGTLIANGAGFHDVIVQSSTGCEVLEEGLLILEPSLSVQQDGAYALVFHSRPGDRAKLCASQELRREPSWSNRGAYWLGEESKLVLPELLVADETGTARIPLDPLAVETLASRGRFYLQALVAPRGELDPMGPASRWSPPIQVTAE